MHLIGLIITAVAQGDKACSNILIVDSLHKDWKRGCGLKGKHYMISIRIAFFVSWQCGWYYEKGETESWIS